MFQLLDFDTIAQVCCHLKVYEVVRLLCTERTMLQYDTDDFFGCLRNSWFSKEFLQKARVRHYASRQSCVKHELCRVEKFQRAVEACDGRRWKDSDFFNLWAAEATFWRRRGRRLQVNHTDGIGNKRPC